MSFGIPDNFCILDNMEEKVITFEELYKDIIGKVEDGDKIHK